MTNASDFLFTAEYIQNVLYFGIVKQGKFLQSTKNTVYLCIDDELVYDNYFSDFGPLNLGCVYTYCKILHEKLKESVCYAQKIIHYTSNDYKKKANAAFLLGCYGVLYLGRQPKEALKPLMLRGQNYKPFQDASPGESQFTITILDCLQAIKKAKELSFFSFQDFDYDEYEKYDRIEGGDLDWIIPGKFLAFIGPVDSRLSLYHPPEKYLEYFQQHNVKIVIRLNKRLYDANVFVSKGIMHYDLFFPDGSCPPRHIVITFFSISEDSECAIGVHCKAGLGRTGSLIGCYLIKHYRMTAHEAIAWMRICRPGSVIGHQQFIHVKGLVGEDGSLAAETRRFVQVNYTLHIKLQHCKKLRYRRRHFNDTGRLPRHKFGIYSIAEKLAKRRIFVMNKSPAPPSFIQARALSPPLNRPHSSSPTRRYTAPRMKEENTDESKKSITREPSEWRMIITSNCPSSREKVSGAGEPKTSFSGCKHKSDTGWKNFVNKPNNTGHFNTWQDSQLATFRASQVPMLKTVNDAKTFLMKSNSYVRKIKENERTWRSSINTVPSNSTERPDISSSTLRNVKYKRRLGRSPSPPVRGPLEHTRATNTPPELDLSFLNSTSCLQEALSRLKLTPARDGSAGAASLGARREAPAGNQTSSVRSDERSTATQGDVLNSIKLQRQLRTVIRSEKKRSKEGTNFTDGSSKMEIQDNFNRLWHTTRPSSSKPRRPNNYNS